MKRSNRIVSVIAVVLAVVLLLMALLPLLFRDRIDQRAKLAANETVNAKVDWHDVGLSFFHSFPHLTITLNGLTTVGTGKFEGDTLAAIQHLRVVLDLGSVLGNVMGGKPLVIRAIELDQPRLSLVQLEDGSANWDITKKSAQPQPQASKPIAVSLRKFEISDAAVRMDNRQSKLVASIIGFNETLSGDFSQSRVSVNTRARADTVSVSFAGIPYLNRVALGLDADVDADLAAKHYTVKSAKLALNKLELALSGSAASAGERMALDLAFKAPATDFRNILSLVPAIYAHDFDKVKTTGTFAVSGTVKGEYGPNVFPAFAITTKVNNATFQYPDLPLPARSIFVDLSLDNPGGSADNTVVKLDRFHIVLGQNPIDAHLLLRTPVSDPDVDASVSGKLDLADLRRTVKLEGIDQLVGHDRLGCRREDPALVRSQESVRQGCRERQRDCDGRDREGKVAPASARDPAGLARARAAARATRVLQRIGGKQRLRSVGHTRQPARLHDAGRHAAWNRDRPQQPLRSRRVEIRGQRSPGDPGAAQDRLHAQCNGREADLRQARE